MSPLRKRAGGGVSTVCVEDDNITLVTVELNIILHHKVGADVQERLHGGVSRGKECEIICIANCSHKLVTEVTTNARLRKARQQGIHVYTEEHW